MDTTIVASQFVDLALKHDWEEIKKLPKEEVQVLLETVVAAGFDPKRIVPGKLKGDYTDQDGSRTGEKYLINDLSPFKVIDQENDDDYFATGWLDCALRRVVFGASRRGEDRQKLIEVIRTEIERSVPLQPVQLTPEGDLLREYPPWRPRLSALEYFVDHSRDEHELISCVGVHMYCNGWVDRHQVTNTHDALVCRKCHLRVLFPKEVKTYGELRQALASKWVQAPA